MPQAGYEKYGEKCRRGLQYWPANAEFVWYCEGFDLPETPRVTAKRNEDLPQLEEFKARFVRYKPSDWRYDVVRFSNKIYAVHDALRDYDGLGVWMDADIAANRAIPEGYIESLLPDGAYIALFQRDGSHSECGLWLVDCTHKQHRPFMDSLLALYEQGNATTRTLSGIPANGDVGNVTVQITGTDAAGATASTAFALAVANVNDAPTVTGSITAQNAVEDQPFALTVDAGLFSDGDVRKPASARSRLRAHNRSPPR